MGNIFRNVCMKHWDVLKHYKGKNLFRVNLKCNNFQADIKYANQLTLQYLKEKSKRLWPYRYRLNYHFIDKTKKKKCESIYKNSKWQTCIQYSGWWRNPSIRLQNDRVICFISSKYSFVIFYCNVNIIPKLNISNIRKNLA